MESVTMARKTCSILFGVFLLLLCLVSANAAFEGTARAYVDPGSGLMLFQSLGAMFTGVLFFFRRRIRSLFSRRSEPQDAGDSQ